MDPFLHLVRLLRPRATLWGGLKGAGRWGVSFRPHGDLLFCWLERGGCQLLCPHVPPVRLQERDFVLIRTVVPFTLASDPTVAPVDSEAAVAATRRMRLRVGTGTRSPVTLHGGRFVFAASNEELLLELMPPLIHVTAGDASSWRVRSLLEMNAAESARPGPGGEFIVARLMELILVEVLRHESLRGRQRPAGLLAGLTDPVTRRALTAMHQDLARAWTVARLARLCGVSRSGFAARFRQVVGRGPVEYLRRWRMAQAKAELSRGAKGIGEIALASGFQSVSAFSAAFTREVGCSPKRFAATFPRVEAAK